MAERRRRVRLRESYDFMGTLLEEGDEQSVVKWDEGFTQAVPNNWIEKVSDGSKTRT